MVIFVEVNGYKRQAGFMIEYLCYLKGLPSLWQNYSPAGFKRTYLPEQHI